MFHATVLTPDTKAFEGQVASLVIPGLDGKFGVLAYHAPMVAGVAAGVLKIGGDVGERYMDIGSGTVTIGNNEAVLLVESAFERTDGTNPSIPHVAAKTDMAEPLEI